MIESIGIYGPNGPVAGSPYTPAVKNGNLLFVSGQLGIDPATKKPYAEFDKQVEGAIAGVRALDDAGCSRGSDGCGARCSDALAESR